ncbi:unnamed protein product [Phytophthora fragariaefolia]|uniref:Unnamed protein product n=1 Tax=Phytophthora fragariaefolia TaxID=1490495 RepID=A0A9W6TLZ7_9STRA|nr:unnamed protein product [Phytophthora fragariaefolia]
MPYCLDNGTTHNVILRSIVDELQLLDPTVTLKALDPPVRGKAVGGTYITCTQSVDLDISLQTVAGLVTQGSSDVDPFDDEREYKDIARPDTDAIKSKLREMLAEAVDNGFPADRSDELYEIVSKRDIWRLQISDDPPARLPPFTIRLKEGAEPYRCKPRKYAPVQRQFLGEFNEKLIQLGWAYKNPESRWACPALPVRKPGKENEWRQTIDFRPVNALTQPLDGGMTNNETHLEDVRGKQHKQTADFIKSFFQLTLAAESQECQSYMTADMEVITPTRLQQGSVDSSLQFQQSIENVMREKDLLFKNVLVWVDDLLIYASTIDEFLEVIDLIYSLLEEYVYFLIQALVEMPAPTTAGALQQFLCATGWMRNSLLDFARICKPLQNRLDKELTGTRRTKKIAGNIVMELTSEELDSFNNVKDLLRNAATLALPDPEAPTCMYSDASDEGWSIILTMVKDWSKTAAEHSHNLLHCMCSVRRHQERQPASRPMKHSTSTSTSTCTMADANMEHHATGMQPDQFMQAIEHIAAGLSQQNAQIYQDFQAYLQGYQQQVQQQLQAHSAQREHKIEGVTMPTYHGRPHESVDEFIFRAKLFMQGKCIDFTNPHNGPRVVAMLAANFRDGAASCADGGVCTS